jgi:hypothetical protein
MMSPGKPEQAASKGGAERPQEQRTAAGGDDRSKQHGAGPQSGYEQNGGYAHQGWAGGPGGYQMPPPWWWGMQPGMSGPYGMFAGMPPGGPQGAAHHHQHHPWNPSQANSPPAGPWSWMSWFMPWLGPWWSWLTSWFVWPGSSWMMPPFSPFAPPPWYPGGPVGAAGDPTLQFAETRASFYRHWFEAQAEIFRQAANACYVPGVAPTPPVSQVDVAQLREALKALPESQAALVTHAVQMMQAWDGMRAQFRSGSDW